MDIEVANVDGGRISCHFGFKGTWMRRNAEDATWSW